MFPRDPLNSVPYSGVRDPEPVSNFFKTDSRPAVRTGNVHLSNPSHVFFGEFMMWVRFTAKIPTLSNHVVVINLGVPQKQMARPHAFSIVAPMKHPKQSWSKSNNPSESMGRPGASAHIGRHLEISVSGISDTPSPQPATFSFSDLGPKSVNHRCGNRVALFVRRSKFVHRLSVAVRVCLIATRVATSLFYTGIQKATGKSAYEFA